MADVPVDDPTPPPTPSPASQPPPPAGPFDPWAGSRSVERPVRPPAEPRLVGPRFVAAVVAGAVATDLVLRTPPWNNVAASVGLVALGLALLGSGRLRSRAAQVAVGAAMVLACFLWLRTNVTLVVFDLAAIVALGWWAAIHARGSSMWDTGPVRLLLRAVDSIVLATETVFDTVTELGARRRRAADRGRLGGERAAAVLRGLAFAVPLLVVLGLLLASADAVFASFFSVDASVPVGTWIGDAMLLALGAWITITLLRLAGRDLTSPGERSGPQVGPIEALVVLIALDVLFAVFALSQLVALTGGADRVLADAGLTFKAYARQGFFQLLWVAAITLLTLVSIHALTRRLERGRRAVVGASLAAVALTLVVVAVAFGRLLLYIGDDGLTPLRFYSSVFSVWIGVVFVLLAVRLAGVAAARSWLTTAIGASAVVFLIGMNVADPDGIIARNNLARDDWAITYHMEKLSADGEVVLFDGLDQLSPEIRADVLVRLCDDPRPGLDQTRGLGFNLAAHRLADRVDRHC